MILDSIENAPLYYALNPLLKVAFDFLASCDPKTLSVGRHDIQGDKVFVNVSELDLRPRSEAALEVHNKYIDIQVLVESESGEEEFGWSQRNKCCLPAGDFDSERDILFYKDTPSLFYALRPGQFTILMPEDAHAPMLGKGHARKLIFKVLR